MKIDKVKGGYMLYKTIDGKTHQLFITEEEVYELSARYELKKKYNIESSIVKREYL